MAEQTKTLNLVVAALGGEGGGVFTNWVIDVARACGWVAQTTSLAGVAQRTGATIYYIELFPESDAKTKPVMSLFPAQGDIDLVITTEIAEAGRMLTRGFVTPERTTLITSTHRVYSINEKVTPGDGTSDPEAILELAHKYAHRVMSYDMAAVAAQHQAVISSVLLGALAGSGVLPFAKEHYTEIIQRTGRAVQTNLAAFEDAFHRASSGGVGVFQPPVDAEPKFQLPPGKTPDAQALIERIRSLPEALHELVLLGVKRLIDYQDISYARTYLQRIETVVAHNHAPLAEYCARYLALWMSFEDIPRVAQLKTRKERSEQIREEVLATDEQVVQTVEFFAPRVEEICAILPRALGAWLSQSPLRKGLSIFTGGRRLRTDRVLIFALMRALAGLRRFRQSSFGFHEENQQIERWYQTVLDCAQRDLELAAEVAHCGRLVKGYGETRRRTSGQLASILQRLTNETSVAEVQSWREAALENTTEPITAAAQAA